MDLAGAVAVRDGKGSDGLVLLLTRAALRTAARAPPVSWRRPGSPDRVQPQLRARARDRFHATCLPTEAVTQRVSPAEEPCRLPPRMGKFSTLPIAMSGDSHDLES
ncbi:hypothetical protein GCM10022254_47240 [Actinomadura meridiana]|uniref:Uncharacterized protein n=1 Tax=Actinomadura meridiana TaxID=559626 RepID=A0ABP8CB88_9ACTN